MTISRLSFASVAIGGYLFMVSEPSLADSALIFNSSNTHWYQRFDNSMGWYQAKAFCEKRGGYLATITSQSENTFVWQNLASSAQTNSGGVWLGATNDKTGTTYQWITGEPWFFTN